MSKKETEQQTKNRFLRLGEERNVDLGATAGRKTPLLGRNSNLDAAVSLALRDPEEPDANAMFEAIRLHDRLQNEKQPEETFEVATISGLERGGVGADRKLVAELGKVLGSFAANEVILVSDGYSDEAVLPLVESAALFSRYLRLIWQNPRYARIALGIPGVLFLLFGILSLLPDALNYYFIAIVLILGSVLLVKGFGVDRGAKNLYKW